MPYHLNLWDTCTYALHWREILTYPAKKRSYLLSVYKSCNVLCIHVLFQNSSQILWFSSWRLQCSNNVQLHAVSAKQLSVLLCQHKSVFVSYWCAAVFIQCSVTNNFKNTITLQQTACKSSKCCFNSTQTHPIPTTFHMLCIFPLHKCKHTYLLDNIQLVSENATVTHSYLATDDSASLSQCH